LLQKYQKTERLLRFFTHKDDIINLELCRKIVEDFCTNTDVQRYNNDVKVEVNDSMICIVSKQASFNLFWFIPVYNGPFQQNIPVWIEPKLSGEFLKFNNNFGYVGELSKTIQALSHFSWVHSKGKLILCDLQGTKDVNGKYILTDPALHSSKKNKYGATDLGIPGIIAFFTTHVCNEICEHWESPKIRNNKITLKQNTLVDSGTKYVFDLHDVGLTDDEINSIENEYNQYYNKD